MAKRSRFERDFSNAGQNALFVKQMITTEDIQEVVSAFLANSPRIINPQVRDGVLVGDVKIEGGMIIGAEIILQSPNGDKWKIAVDNVGQLKAVSANP